MAEIGSVCFVHGGRFDAGPPFKYVGGKYHEEGVTGEELSTDWVMEVVVQTLKYPTVKLENIFFRRHRAKLPEGLLPMVVEGCERHMLEIIYSEGYLDIFIDHDVAEPMVAPAALPWREKHLNGDDYNGVGDGEDVDRLESELYSEEDEDYENRSSTDESGSSEVEDNEGGRVRRNLFRSATEGEEEHVGSQGDYLRGYKSGAPSSPYPKRRKCKASRPRQNPDANDQQVGEDNIEEEEEDMFGMGDLNVDSGEEVEPEEYYFTLDPKTPKTRKGFYDPEAPIPNISLGVCFTDHNEFKQAMTKYSVRGGYHLKHTKNEPGRQRYKCLGGNCEWVVFAGADRDDDGEIWWIKTIGPEHTCSGRSAFVRVDSRYIAKHFHKKISEKPFTKVTEMVGELKEKFDVDVSWDKCNRAKRRILRDLEGNYREQYSQLRAYGNYVLSLNKENTVKLQYEEDANGAKRFQRYCMSFGVC